jgi:hypothetical protein
MRTILLPLLLAAAASAQQPVAPVQFEGRPGIRLSNDKLSATILSQGGPVVELLLPDDPEKLNPLWNPVRFAREAGQTERGQQGSSFGNFICVDGFGPVSKEEQAAGLSGHGEAHHINWENESHEKRGNTTTLKFSLRLPLVQEVFTRTLQLVDGENVMYIESELENLLGFDRPINWAEHATIGSPFLEPGKTVVDISAGPSRTRSHDSDPARIPYLLAPGQDFVWPMAPRPNGQLFDVRIAPLNPNSSGHTATLLDRSRRLVYVTALHPEKRLLIGYVFRREEYPWLQSWLNYPGEGRLARGMEFGTQPYDVPRRQTVTEGTMFGAPTYRWLPAKSKIGSRFLLFYTRTPEGMQGVDDVRLENGQLVIEDHASGKRLTLPASLPL